MQSIFSGIYLHKRAEGSSCRLTYNPGSICKTQRNEIKQQFRRLQGRSSEIRSADQHRSRRHYFWNDTALRTNDPINFLRRTHEGQRNLLLMRPGHLYFLIRPIDLWLEAPIIKTKCDIVFSCIGGSTTTDKRPRLCSIADVDLHKREPRNTSSKRKKRREDWHYFLPPPPCALRMPHNYLNERLLCSHVGWLKNSAVRSYLDFGVIEKVTLSYCSFSTLWLIGGFLGTQLNAKEVFPSEDFLTTKTFWRQRHFLVEV